ncbi:MAG: hypothetical protein U0795_20350 [Pirellulales bacterium]
MSSDTLYDIRLNVAVRRMVEAQDRLELATKESNAALQDVQRLAIPSSRCVVRVDYRSWLLEADGDGNVQLSQIEVL